MHSTRSSQHLKFQNLTPHKDSDIQKAMHQFTIFKFLISVLLIFVPQFEDFVIKVTNWEQHNHNLFVCQFLNKPSVVWFCTETVNFGQFAITCFT